MSANKQVVQRWFDEVWNKGRAEAIDEILDPDATVAGLSPQPFTGPAALKGVQSTFLTAFPDLRIAVDELIEEGHSVAFRFTVTGTHDGALNGIPASGRPVLFTGMGIARVRGDRIVEGWNVFDQLALLQQIGAVPTP